MSTVDRNRVKVVLPRSGSDSFWAAIHEHYAGESPLLWKRLAMLALRENAGWPLDRIGEVFGHHKGHVQRSIEKTKAELRQRFRASPDYLELDALDEDRPDEVGAAERRETSPPDSCFSPDPDRPRTDPRARPTRPNRSRDGRLSRERTGEPNSTAPTAHASGSWDKR